MAAWLAKATGEKNTALKFIGVSCRPPRMGITSRAVASTIGTNTQLGAGRNITDTSRLSRPKNRMPTTISPISERVNHPNGDERTEAKASVGAVR